MFVKYKR